MKQKAPAFRHCLFHELVGTAEKKREQEEEEEGKEEESGVRGGARDALQPFFFTIFFCAENQLRP
jgi:hypothetical protein